MFAGDRYTVERRPIAIGTRYTVYEDDVHVLSSKRRTYGPQGAFRFTDPGGVPILRLATDDPLSVAATYSLFDERTDEVVGALRRDWRSALAHHWQLFDDEGVHVATVREDGLLRAAIRRKLTARLPFSYAVVAGDGTRLGDIAGSLTDRDAFAVDLSTDEKGLLDPRLAVATAVMVDAVEET